MYKRETRAIGKLFETTMMRKYGPAEVSQQPAERPGSSGPRDGGRTTACQADGKIVVGDE